MTTPSDPDDEIVEFVRVEGSPSRLPFLSELPPGERAAAMMRAFEEQERGMAARRHLRREPRIVTALPPEPAVIRTWFGDDAAWERLVEAAVTPTPEGFVAQVCFVDAEEFAGLTPDGLRTDHPGTGSISFLADEVTLGQEDAPVLVVPMRAGPDGADRVPFRVVVSWLWSVENNLSISNMDWEDFARNLDEDGVFRGFPPDPPAPPQLVDAVVGAAAGAAVARLAELAESTSPLERGELTVTLTREADIDRAAVFARAAMLDTWLGAGGIPDFRPGGRFVVFIAHAPLSGVGSVTAWEPESVIAFDFAWAGTTRAELPSERTHVRLEFLEPSSGRTQVRVTHSRLPETLAEQAAAWWSYALEFMLAVAAGKGYCRPPWN